MHTLRLRSNPSGDTQRVINVLTSPNAQKHFTHQGVHLRTPLRNVTPNVDSLGRVEFSLGMAKRINTALGASLDETRLTTIATLLHENLGGGTDDTIADLAERIVEHCSATTDTEAESAQN